MISLLYDETRLTIAPSHPAIEKTLKFRDRKIAMARVPGTKRMARQIVYQEVESFFVVTEYAGRRVIQTHAGYLDRVIYACRKNGILCSVNDMRRPFPTPQWSKMRGFRCKQRELLTRFLQKDRNGLLGAPPRYGKTKLMINACRAFPDLCTVVVTPGTDLVQQLFKDFTEELPNREVFMLGAGSRKQFPSEDITVCSMDSLHKCDPGRVRLLLVDEPHMSVTDSRYERIIDFEKARKLGFGATNTNRFDGRHHLLEGLIGPGLVELTYPDAVAEGAVAPIMVLMLRVPLNDDIITNQDRAYKTHMCLSENMAEITRQICREVIPPAWQTLLFIKNEDQAEHYLERIGRDGTIAMAKRMTSKERKETTRRMQANEIQRCLATVIYSTGVTFHDCRVVVNLEGGGAYSYAVQKPGRVGELIEGKRCGVLIDFLFEPAEPHPEADARDPHTGEKIKTPDWGWKPLRRDSLNRLELYRKKGYDIVVCEDVQALHKAFNEKAI